MTHPVQLVFEHLTCVVQPAMEPPISLAGKTCDCCGRDAVEFNNEGYQGLNSYKMPYVHCVACHSFNVGSIDITGVERLAKGNPVPQKFGMMTSVGAVIELSTGRAVLFAPEKIIQKFPAKFTDAVEVHNVKSSQHINWIIENKITFPMLYIKNFGRKTYELIGNLRVSHSFNEFWICDESIKNTFMIPVTATLNIFDELCKVSPREHKLFLETAARQARGTISPKDAGIIWKANPELIPIAQMLPHDPHIRLSMFSFIRAI